MALPYRRQQLAKFIPFNDLTYADVAEALGVEWIEVSNLANGARYPSPDELRALSKLFNALPVETFFEPELLRYRMATQWPPRGRGFRGPRHPVTPYPDPATAHKRQAE